MTKVHEWLEKRAKEKEVMPAAEELAEIIVKTVKEQVEIWAVENCLTREETIKILTQQLSRYEDLLQSSRQNAMIEAAMAKSHEE